MQYVAVARVGDCPPNSTLPIEVQGQALLLVNDGGTFRALQGLCPHRALSLAGATVWRGVLDCPWHHFQYDVRTGENLYPRRVYPLATLPKLTVEVQPLDTYPVRIIAGQVQVELPDSSFEGDPEL